MPNKPRKENPARPVRVEDELWLRARAKARNEGTTVSEVIREALREYVDGGSCACGHKEGGHALASPRWCLVKGGCDCAYFEPSR